VGSDALLYTSRILRHFRLRTGKPGSLTMQDQRLVQQWQEEGISCDCVLKGIDKAFSNESDVRVQSLAHCDSAVRQIFDETTLAV